MEIGAKQSVTGIPPVLVDKYIDVLFEHGGQNSPTGFKRDGSLSSALITHLIQVTIEYFERPQPNWREIMHNEKDASRWRMECRDYLMQVEPQELTVGDALEALGYGRNGLQI